MSPRPDVIFHVENIIIPPPAWNFKTGRQSEQKSKITTSPDGQQIATIVTILLRKKIDKNGSILEQIGQIVQGVVKCDKLCYFVIKGEKTTIFYFLKLMHKILSVFFFQGLFPIYPFSWPPCTKKGKKKKNLFASQAQSAPFERQKLKGCTCVTEKVSTVDWLTRRSPSLHCHCCLIQGVISQQDPGGPPTQRT